MLNSMLTPEVLPVHGRRFRKAIHFSHDGIVLNLRYGWGAIAIVGGNSAPDCGIGGTGRGGMVVVE
ncbi:hypothetical protein [Duganella aceris]|jgi:hypothetical protein|uniref:hypothetical protein n=1 Tax=Duganella aceris TaxID=2703883 RepID=UPI0014079690|nr:hypothetical protein [Duganella aceris]